METGKAANPPLFLLGHLTEVPVFPTVGGDG